MVNVDIQMDHLVVLVLINHGSTLHTSSVATVPLLFGFNHLCRNSGMVWDTTNDVLYVADYGNNAIRRILPDGTVDTWLAKGITEPCALALDEKGGIFVCGNHAVCHINAGTAVSFFPSFSIIDIIEQLFFWFL
jgi:hypothetical protein